MAPRSATGYARRRSRLIAAICSVVGVAGTPSPALAQHKSATGTVHALPLPCRPTIACTAELVPPGHFEVEVGYTGRRSSDGFHHATPALLKITVVDALQLQLATNGLVAERGHAPRFDLPLTAAKVRLLKEGEAAPAIAVSAGIGMPVHPRHHARDCSTGAQVVAYASKEISSVHADLNIGATVLDLDGTRRAQPVAAFALSRDVGHGVTAMAEGYVLGDAAPVASLDHGALVAVGWMVWPSVVLDVGGDWGMGNQDRRFTAFIGATVLGPRVWSP